MESFDLYARPLVVASIILAGFTLGIGALMNQDLNYWILSGKIGVWRYFTVQTALMKGTFPVTRFGPAFIALALGVIIGAIFMLLLASDE